MDLGFFLNPFFPLVLVLGVAVIVAIVELFKSIRIVPARSALVVERVGKYAGTLEAGFHLLVPFLDRVRYTHSLKEISLAVPPQPCFTEDNVRVEVGGVLYLMVTDPRKASYGISDYKVATIQLAQTMMRSVIGRLELDKTFEERDSINATIVRHLDEALEAWGVKVTRYEIQTITPPASILKTMELQVNAERDKRAKIAKSIGEMNSRINTSIGIMEEAVNRSEGEKQRQINEAEGKAAEILALSRATAASIEKIAASLVLDGGGEAARLQITEQYINQIGKAATKGNRVILPLDLTDVGAIVQSTKELT
ncbi:MAG TPA: stomatin-like protein [Spirochaetia bacterium]|nr:stomatin-like protein [Spirochaetia bacterium]